MKVLLSLLLGFSFLFSAIDINNASQSQLEQLQGIGAKKAERIVAYREQHCFKNINELQNVKGIGQKTIEKNKSELSVGNCKN